VLVDDLYPYVAFAAGWLVGRRWPSRSPWVARSTLASVLALVAFLGASFRPISASQFASVLPSSIAFASLVLGATAAIYLSFRRLERVEAVPPGPARTARPAGFPTSLAVLGALVAGYAAGRLVALPSGVLIPAALSVLLALIGYGLELAWASVRRAWVPIAAAGAGAVAAAVGFALLARLATRTALATSLAFGWYSLAGPLVGARLGATAGLFTFLANFLREALTMVLAPYVGPRLKGEGLAALGGATSMDTTLYFIVRHGDGRAGSLAIATGLTLTVAASLLVPLVLAL
jgi:uncharacterized membrane protein YbjE (DUF340 family)